MSRPENQDKHSSIDKNNHEDSITVTVKLTWDKDIVAAAVEYSKSFFESYLSAYQETSTVTTDFNTRKKILQIIILQIYQLE